MLIRNEWSRTDIIDGCNGLRRWKAVALARKTARIAAKTWWITGLLASGQVYLRIMEADQVLRKEMKEKVKEEYFKQLIKSAWSTHFENENVQVSTIIGNQENMK